MSKRFDLNIVTLSGETIINIKVHENHVVRQIEEFLFEIFTLKNMIYSSCSYDYEYNYLTLIYEDKIVDSNSRLKEYGNTFTLIFNRIQYPHPLFNITLRCYYNEYSNNEYSLPSSFTIKKTKEFLFRLNYKTNEEYVYLIKKRIDNSDGKEFFGFVGKIKVNNDDIIEDIFEKNKLLSGIVLNVKNDDMLIDYNSVISINEERSDMMNIYLYKNKEEQEHFISTILIHKTYTINDIKWYVSSIEMKNKPQYSYVDHSFYYIEEGDIDLNQTV